MSDVDVSHAINCFDVLKIISQINLNLHTQIVEGVCLLALEEVCVLGCVLVLFVSFVVT